MGPENLSPTMLIQGVSTDAFFLKWCCAALSMSRSSRGSYWKRSQRNLQEKSFACSFGADMCFGDCALKIQLSTSSSHIRSGLFHLRRRHRACKRRHLRIRVQALALRHDRIQPQNFRWPEGKAIRFGVDAGKRARADLGSTCLYSLVTLISVHLRPGLLCYILFAKGGPPAFQQLSKEAPTLVGAQRRSYIDCYSFTAGLRLNCRGMAKPISVAIHWGSPLPWHVPHSAMGSLP